MRRPKASYQYSSQLPRLAPLPDPIVVPLHHWQLLVRAVNTAARRICDAQPPPFTGGMATSTAGERDAAAVTLLTSASSTMDCVICAGGGRTVFRLISRPSLK